MSCVSHAAPHDDACLFLLCRWAFNEGQDFPADHSSASLDYASIHLWPDAWLDESSSFPTTWLNAHMTDAAALGKPVSRIWHCRELYGLGMHVPCCITCCHRMS